MDFQQASIKGSISRLEKAVPYCSSGSLRLGRGMRCTAWREAIADLMTS